jgi:hypothetical protein
MTVLEFMDKHSAPLSVLDSIHSEHKTMKEVWDSAEPRVLLWIATRTGALEDHQLRLFLCWCIRTDWDKLTYRSIENMIVMAERYAKGEVSAQAMLQSVDEAREDIDSLDLAARRQTKKYKRMATQWAIDWAQSVDGILPTSAVDRQEAILFRLQEEYKLALFCKIVAGNSCINMHIALTIFNGTRGASSIDKANYLRANFTPNL